MRLAARDGEATAVEPVVVVGAGISGIACAAELAAAGLPVRVLDRGHRVGGRMALRTLHGRPVDIGASYLTARAPEFLAVVEDWHRRGVARPWTDTFHIASPDGLQTTTTGSVRWAAPEGLRALVEDLAATAGVQVEHPCEVAAVGPGATVDGVRAAAVVLAMPDPQALDLLSDAAVDERATLSRGWDPVLALVAGWDDRGWPTVDGVFVNDSGILTWIADDGRRRGDGAPVLVAHSTAVLAGRHLDDPAAAQEIMLDELGAVLDIGRPPAWALVTRWSLASPRAPRAEPYYLSDGMLGACGDGWGGRPRVEGAFLSGRALGRQIAARLA